MNLYDDEPKRSQEASKARKWTPEGSKREPKGAKMSEKVTEREPKGVKREPKGAQREPKGSQRATKMHPKIDVRKRSRKGRQKGERI